MENVTASKVKELLDCAAYYTLMKLPLPSNQDEKVEASNPGSLLVEVNRIIDTVPYSRNESMASFLRIEEFVRNGAVALTAWRKECETC